MQNIRLISINENLSSFFLQKGENESKKWQKGRKDFHQKRELFNKTKTERENTNKTNKMQGN